MKKLTFILAVTISLFAGAIFTSCQSNDQKVKAAKERVQDARQDLIEAQTEAYDAEAANINAEEWKAFKVETDNNIKNNELRIAELRVQLEKPGKIFDPVYKNKIEVLEQKNLDMKNRLNAYKKRQNNWEIFKAEFNHDMEELKKALREFTFVSKN